MAILIANIGTSDLAIEISGYGYFPAYFDRNQPNIDYSGLTDNEQEAWKQRETFIKEIVCSELGVQVVQVGGNTKYAFREFTQKLLDAYRQNPDDWHPRIRPGRIWGAVIAARNNFQVTKAHIFVTDQPHDADSIYLFDILQEWFSREIPALTLKAEIIPRNIKANDEDGLLNHYYHFFNRTISSNATILISIKGGTPQMQTALKMQALSSSAQRQIFVDPILSIQKLLAGEASECKLTSYWRYMRTQKYQIVNQLLKERWDFDGARQILRDWQANLQFLISENVIDSSVSQSNDIIELVIQALDVALHYFNFDNYSANRMLDENLSLPRFSSLDGAVNTQNDTRILNLYTQCRIYWELDQVANFLARMSSFYEETLYRLVEICDGTEYCNYKWYLNTTTMRQEMGDVLWQAFRDSEWDNNPRFQNHNFQVQPMFQLQGRPDKLNFVNVLMRHRQIPQEQQEVLDKLRSLDYWARIRNDLVHGARGVSKARMSELLDEYRNRFPDAEAVCDARRASALALSR